jgi:hypothetical protein
LVDFGVLLITVFTHAFILGYLGHCFHSRRQ